MAGADRDLEEDDDDPFFRRRRPKHRLARAHWSRGPYLIPGDVLEHEWRDLRSSLFQLHPEYLPSDADLQFFFDGCVRRPPSDQVNVGTLSIADASVLPSAYCPAAMWLMAWSLDREAVERASRRILLRNGFVIAQTPGPIPASTTCLFLTYADQRAV